MLAAVSRAASPQAREQYIFECAARLPSPPDIVIALVRTIDNDRSSPAQIARLIERDPVLTARVLKVSNSPFYGMAGRVGTVRDAVLILGFSSVCNLVVAIEIANRFGSQDGTQAQLAGFWRHGMLAALCSAALARRNGADGGLAFTGGLLHDIGTLVLARAYPDEAALRSAAVAKHPAARDDLAAERELFGMDHAELGGWIVERWRFPPSIAEALRSHHDGRTASPLARAICHADPIAHAIGGPRPADAALLACADALDALGSREPAHGLLDEIERQAGVAAEILNGNR